MFIVHSIFILFNINVLCYYCFSEKQELLIGAMFKENEELTNLLNESEVQNMVQLNYYVMFN